MILITNEKDKNEVKMWRTAEAHTEVYEPQSVAVGVTWYGASLHVAAVGRA